MIDLELKSFSSDFELESWRPSRVEDVFLVLDMRIGEKGDDRADTFYVTVATPPDCESTGPSLGRSPVEPSSCLCTLWME